ncbi:hypothetical protein K8Q98_02765 [Candidatus Nomurabacteria bacterium]|nr:hypothetical protein [Candidatus Nomurabacteria bacterium]
MAMERNPPSFYKKPDCEIGQASPKEKSGRDFYDLSTDPKLSMEDLVKAKEAGSISEKQFQTLKDALMEKLRLF